MLSARLSLGEGGKMEEYYIKSGEIIRCLSVGRSLFDKIKKQKGFPESVEFGNAHKRWNMHEIDAWIRTKRIVPPLADSDLPNRTETPDETNE